MTRLPLLSGVLFLAVLPRPSSGFDVIGDGPMLDSLSAALLLIWLVARRLLATLFRVEFSLRESPYIIIGSNLLFDFTLSVFSLPVRQRKTI